MPMETIGHKTFLELNNKTKLQRSPDIKTYNGSIQLVLQNLQSPETPGKRLFTPLTCSPARAPTYF